MMIYLIKIVFEIPNYHLSNLAIILLFLLVFKNLTSRVKTYGELSIFQMWPWRASFCIWNNYIQLLLLNLFSYKESWVLSLS